jgi:hypothetical protein
LFYTIAGLYKLMATCLCVMVGNAEAERVFSMQNRIKTQLRNQLTIDRLDKLLRIKYHANINIAHLQAAAERFLAAKNRRI